MGTILARQITSRLSLIRSERWAAGLLLSCAVLALILANSGIGGWLLRVQATHLTVPLVDLSLPVGHWVSDGLLAVFFFIVAVELRHELAVGQLNSMSKALAPAIAAFGGVLTPALIVLAFTIGSGYARGWPVPTATDIAFSLGVLAMFGKGIPSRVRVFLMALAVLDDLVGILIIAIFFAHDIDLIYLTAAAVTVACFGLLSRYLGPRSRWLVPVLAVIGLVAWYFMARSGVHATIAGVALGAVMASRPAATAAHRLLPVSNGVCLPLFAFSAALVPIPAVSVTELNAVFWGILIGLPVGKFIGITVAAWLTSLLANRRGNPFLSLPDIMTVATLGGIGFTVSLLMNELAFARTPEVADEGTVAVLLGSAISIVSSALVVTLRARHYRRLGPLPR